MQKQITGTLYKTDGEVVNEIVPKNGTDFQLEELYAMLNTDMIEVIPLGENRIMIIDEEGKLKLNPKTNFAATNIFRHDRIVGNALVTDSRGLK